MAWSLLDSGTVTFSDGVAGHVYTYPAGPPAAGDLLVLGVNGVDTTATPTGWTLGISNVSVNQTYCFYKIAGAAEPGSVTVTTASSVNTALSFLRYSGASATPRGTTASIRRVNAYLRTAVNLDPWPDVGATAGQLGLLFAANLDNADGVVDSQSNPVPELGWSVLLDTGVLGGDNSTTAVQQYVVGRTDGVGVLAPDVTWSGMTFIKRTSVFISFLPAPAPVAAGNVAAQYVSGGVAAPVGALQVRPDTWGAVADWAGGYRILVEGSRQGVLLYRGDRIVGIVDLGDWAVQLSDGTFVAVPATVFAQSYEVAATVVGTVWAPPILTSGRRARPARRRAGLSFRKV